MHCLIPLIRWWKLKASTIGTANACYRCMLRRADKYTFILCTFKVCARDAENNIKVSSVTGMVEPLGQKQL